MVKTARKLYEVLSQNGEPPLTMMRTMLAVMQPVDFKVTKEAAKFAAEAPIHHLCAVANLIKTCCLEGAAYDLVTDLARSGAREVHRMEGGADKPGCRAGAEPVQAARRGGTEGDC